MNTVLLQETISLYSVLILEQSSIFLCPPNILLDSQYVNKIITKILSDITVVMELRYGYHWIESVHHHNIHVLDPVVFTSSDIKVPCQTNQLLVLPGTITCIPKNKTVSCA